MDRYTMHTTYNGSRFSTQAIQNLDPATAKDVSSQTEWVRYEEAREMEAERAKVLDKIARLEENQLTGAELIECICKELQIDDIRLMDSIIVEHLRGLKFLHSNTGERKMILKKHNYETKSDLIIAMVRDGLELYYDSRKIFYDKKADGSPFRCHTHEGYFELESYEDYWQLWKVWETGVIWSYWKDWEIKDDKVATIDPVVLEALIAELEQQVDDTNSLSAANAAETD
ncbi:MAG: hypothetical protein GY931_06195 [Maribacter sp.]|nr:hypothetical protein [Maribacter sp.]